MILAKTLTQPHFLRPAKRFAFFSCGNGLVTQPRQRLVEFRVEIEIRMRGIHVGEQGMIGGAREFSFVACPAKMFDHLRLRDLKIVVTHKGGDA